MEPVSYVKRRRYSELLMEPKRRLQPTVEEVKQRLKELRLYSLDHHDALITKLTASLAANPNAEITFSQGAEQAVETIRRIAHGAQIAINKSAVVSRELSPFFTVAGSPVLEPYYNELSEMDIRFTKYWQLPEIPFEMRLHAFECQGDLLARRQIRISEQGVRDLVAVIGVNAISAEDGGVVLLQHRQNIGRMLEECREIILIVGIDRIVPTMDDAVYQTKCMAWFGMDSLALGLGGKAVPSAGLDGYPFKIAPEELSGKVTVILLDNGRRGIMESEYRELLHCIGCRACITQCPCSSFFNEDVMQSPREFLFLSLLNIGKPLDHCIQCKNCRTVCPADIDLPGLILRLRNSRKKGRLMPLADLMFSNAEEVERMGSLFAPFANTLSRNRLVKRISESLIGISRNRALPSFSAKTFESIYRDIISGSGR